MSSKYSARLPLSRGFAALVVLIGLIGTWSVLAKISGAVIATGVVEVESNRQVIEHPDGGVVADILVKDGDTVTAGAPLIRLDAKLLTSELQIIEDQYGELLARQARLIAERDLKERLVFSQELTTYFNKTPDQTQILLGQKQFLEARTARIASEAQQLDIQKDQIEKQITGIEAQLTAFKLNLTLLRKSA